MWIRCAWRSRPSPDCTTARPRASWMSCRSAPPPRSCSRSPNTHGWPRACCPRFIDKEVQGLGVHSFSQSIRQGFDVGLINERVLAFVEANARKLNAAIDATRTHELEYFGLRTLYDRYLLRHPTRRSVLENPAVLLDAHRGGAQRRRARGHRAVPAVLQRSTTSPARRRCSTPARATSSSPAASCWIRPRTRWSPSTTSTRTSRCCRSSPAASAWPGIACARKAR